MGFKTFNTIVNLQEGLSQEDAFESIILAVFGNTDSANNAIATNIGTSNDANKDMLLLGYVVNKELNFQVRRIGKRQIEINSYNPPNIPKIIDVLMPRFTSFNTIINLRGGLTQEEAFKIIASAVSGNKDIVNNSPQDATGISTSNDANKDMLSLGYIIDEELNFRVRRIGKKQIEVNSYHPPNVSKTIDVLTTANIH